MENFLNSILFVLGVQFIELFLKNMDRENDAYDMIGNVKKHSTSTAACGCVTSISSVKPILFLA